MAVFAVTVGLTFGLVGCGDGSNQILGSDASAPVETGDQIAKAAVPRPPTGPRIPAERRVSAFAAIKAITSGSNEILSGGGPGTWGAFNGGFVTATNPAVSLSQYPAGFSRVSVVQRGTSYSVSSTFTSLNEADGTGRISLDLSVSTDGRSVFTFNGSGWITTPDGRYALSAPQRSISGSMRPPQSLIRYDVPALPGAGVGISLRDGLLGPNFRLCVDIWNFPAPWQSREICWWHRKADGKLDYVDLIGSSNARPFPNRGWHTSSESPNYTRVLLSCVVREGGFRAGIGSGGSITRTRRHFAIARFDTRFFNGGLYMPPPPLSSLRESFRITPAGKVYAIGDSTRSRTWVVRDNRVIRYTDAPVSVIDIGSKSTTCVPLT